MRRLSKLFREDGNMVVVAMDHGLGMSVNPALDDVGENRITSYNVCYTKLLRIEARYR